MVDVDALSDAELRTKLMEFGYPVMPITGTTRKLMVKKLKLLIESQNKNVNDRRSLGRYSSEEESDGDTVKSATRRDKSRRITVAVPSSISQQSKPGGTLRKSLRRNDSGAAEHSSATESPEMIRDAVGRTSKRTTTTTKLFKSVQDEFDTGSDSEPEIMEFDYQSSGQSANNCERKRDSPPRSTFGSSLFNYPPLPSPPSLRYSSAKRTAPSSAAAAAASSDAYSPPVSNRSVSPARYSTYHSPSTNDTDTALDRLNQIRSRLSLGSTGYERASPSYDTNDEKTETPFLSNFTRRLSQLSNANSPKPEFDYKNDVIKEHDTNGAGNYARNYLGRSRYRGGIGGRDHYSRRNSGNFVRDNLVSFAVLGVALLFFIFVGAMYWGMRSDEVAIRTPGYAVPRCVPSDPAARPGLNCVTDADLDGAIELLNDVKPELTRRAVAHACGSSIAKPYMEEADVINFRHRLTGEDLFEVQRRLAHLEVLLFANPEWGISVVRIDEGGSGVGADDVLAAMDEVIELRPSKSIALAALAAAVPWRCSLYDKACAVLNALLALAVASSALYLCNVAYGRARRQRQRRRAEVYAVVERIVDTLQANGGGGGHDFLVINHVRDMIIPVADRKRMEGTWEEAVQFMRENESRVRTEVQVVQGEPFEVWRWLGSPSLNAGGSSPPRPKTWQGQAFETQVGSVNSLPCSPTPCLKVRGMVDENETNFHPIREAVLGKCAHQCRLLHCAVDAVSKCVYLKCADQNDAAVAYRNLHGWWYAGHLVTVKYLRLERYMQRFPDSPVDGPPYLRITSPATDRSS